MNAKKKGPVRPACGSIEQNNMIRAINMRKENPYPNSPECIEFWNSLVAEKNKDSNLYFSCVEPDEYEDFVLSRMI